MEKKESYKHALPHFQQPGQAYFVTWCLKDAVPRKALKRYANSLNILLSQIHGNGFVEELFKGSSYFQLPRMKSAIENRGIRDEHEIEKLRDQYYALRKKYIKAYDNLLDADRHPTIDLSKTRNTEILAEALHFWEGKRLVNHAFSIMPNHVHWVFELLEKDEAGQPVYLQDVLQSVKRYTANQINKAEEKTGTLWQKESFDTSIRDGKHLYYAVEYTLNNPVSAGLVNNRNDWPGNFFGSGCGSGCGDL